MDPEDVYSLAIRVEEEEISRQEFRRRLNESENFYTEGRTTDRLVYQGIDTDTTVEFYLTERKVEVYTGDMERFREGTVEASSKTPRLPEPNDGEVDDEDSEEDSSEVITQHLEVSASKYDEVVRYLEAESRERKDMDNRLKYTGEGWSAILYMTDDVVNGLELSWDVESSEEPYEEVLGELQKYGETVSIRIGEGSQSLEALNRDSFVDLLLYR